MTQLHTHKPAPTAIALALLMASTIAGCDGWPRYANKPSIDENALKPGADPSDNLAINWSDPQSESEPNDQPNDALEIGIKDGKHLNGVLSGLGWDSEKMTERISECGDTLAFPPDTPGGYTGDIDWIPLQTIDDGVLCMQLETDEIDARLDAVLYTMDDCGEPTALFVHPETGVPLGSNQKAGSINWAISVESDQTIGIAIAGFWPDDIDIELDWDLSIALVPAVSGSADILCPEAS